MIIYSNIEEQTFAIGKQDCIWFIMYWEHPFANYKIYTSLENLINDLSIYDDLYNQIKLESQKYINSIITIQKYYKSWKIRMKYRYNPETNLCKYLLYKDYCQII